MLEAWTAKSPQLQEAEPRTHFHGSPSLDLATGWRSLPSASPVPMQAAQLHSPFSPITGESLKDLGPGPSALFCLFCMKVFKKIPWCIPTWGTTFGFRWGRQHPSHILPFPQPRTPLNLVSGKDPPKPTGSQHSSLLTGTTGCPYLP